MFKFQYLYKAVLKSEVQKYEMFPDCN